ncbi:MAG: hypothetical protein RLZZ347_135 [Candidatus Parcubacteria bacterium]
MDGLRETEQKRLATIAEEFANGFAFIRKYPRSVTFFGSARISEGNIHYEQARSLAQRIVDELHYAIVTGGGPGIMEAGNRGASEAGGDSVGILIQLPKEQASNPYVKDSLEFHHFFARKVVMSFAAEAYVFFPGGFGTMDEFFEIITLIQTHKIPHMPIILVGEDFWRPLDGFIKKNILENHHAINPEDRDLYTITDDMDKVIEMIKKAPVSTT